MHKKLILTDVDGTVLNWVDRFDYFMSELGHPRLPNMSGEYAIAKQYAIDHTSAMKYVDEFNSSDWIVDLEPFADSKEYIAKLHSLGFKFIAVSAIGLSPDALLYRTRNLETVFGGAFIDVHCVDHSADKAVVLSKWADTGYFWIEDHMRHAEAGYEVGLSPILINHDYNKHYTTDLFPKVSVEKPWEEIYNHIINRYF